jgi:hypothetical protein
MSDTPPDPHKAVLDHAWNWFSMHAQQRMTTINFFLVVQGALLGALGVTADKKLYGYQFYVGLLIVLMALMFFALDKRVRKLIEIGETALKTEQSRLAADVSDTHIELLRLSDECARWRPTYGRIFDCMFLIFVLIGVGASYVAARGMGCFG